MEGATLVIDPRFNGPPASANGGYTCGLLAQALEAPAAEVTLHLPPPLGRALRLARDGERIELLDGEALVASAVAAPLELDVPEGVSFLESMAAAEGYAGFARHAFPTCFVCGPGRPAADGLAIFAGPVEGRPLVAAPWQPAADAIGADGLVRPELVWASLDCPGAFAVGWAERGETLLGRLHASIEARPRAGERCVVSGWPLGEEGRKLYAGTALRGEDGRVLARARATWIVPAG